MDTSILCYHLSWSLLIHDLDTCTSFIPSVQSLINPWYYLMIKKWAGITIIRVNGGLFFVQNTTWLVLTSIFNEQRTFCVILSAESFVATSRIQAQTFIVVLHYVFVLLVFLFCSFFLKLWAHWSSRSKDGFVYFFHLNYLL